MKNIVHYKKDGCAATLCEWGNLGAEKRYNDSCIKMSGNGVILEVYLDIKAVNL